MRFITICSLLLLAAGPAWGQCAGGQISNCPAATTPQPTDYVLGWQNGENPHTRKFTVSQLQVTGAITGPGITTIGWLPQWADNTGSSLSAGFPVGLTGNNTVVRTDGTGLIDISLVPVFTSLAAGVVPASGGSSTDCLRGNVTWGPCSGGAVTSVGLTMPGIFSVSGSPVTSSGTLAVTAAGTSGGVPYFSGATTLASSGALTANAPVIGGGAGIAPSSGSRSGNTTTFATTSGALTSGNCSKFDPSGNLIDAGAPCGTGSGTVTTTGSPASGNLTKFSGATSVTSGDLSGDVTTSGTLATTVVQVNGAVVPLSASVVSTNASRQLTAASTTGSGSVVLATSPTLTTPALGTPSALVLTNATSLPCGAMPALTGGVTSSAGSCATTAASVPTTALTGTVTDELCATWDSNTSVVAATVSFPITWATYTIAKVKSAVNGGGSFTANVKIGSTSVTSCSAISVSGATNTNTTCTAANTGVVDDIINVVITSPSGTVNQAYVCPVFTHSVN